MAEICPGDIDTPLLDMAPNDHSNGGIRERVHEIGLEITPVEAVADAAWAAVHGNRIHTLVGKTARQSWFAARWLRGKMRKRSRMFTRPMGD